MDLSGVVKALMSVEPRMLASPCGQPGDLGRRQRGGLGGGERAGRLLIVVLLSPETASW